MKTIDERAKLRSEYYDEDDGYSAGVYVGYIDGATEQKEIDIDKACEWLDTYLVEISELYDWRANLLLSRVTKRLRKAMEEQL